VARAEPVEKVDERHAAFNGGEMGGRAEVHDLLRVGSG
jgi:hypothetical protein